MNELKKLESRYRNKLNQLLKDNSINKYNRELFKKFFKWEEDKLEHGSNTGRLTVGNFKTLHDYISKLLNVNKWFKNRAWNTLTEKDIKDVRRDLIDGKIRNKYNRPYGDVRSYINKIFKHKPFKLAGLGDIIDNVFEFSIKTPRKEVRFIKPQDAKRMIMSAKNYSHKALLCLAWDIGENIDSLLQLKWKWVKEYIDDETKKTKFSIYLPPEILKESRTPRTEITIFDETVDALINLRKMGKTIQKRNDKGFFTGESKYEPFEENDLLFNFEYRRAYNLFKEYAKRCNVKCEPNNEEPTWKDFRSGMACNLFDLGWTAEEVNLRLGHSALSKQFGVYVNYKSMNRKQTVRKHDKITLKQVEDKLEESEMARERQESRHKKELELQNQRINRLYELLEKEMMDDSTSHNIDQINETIKNTPRGNGDYSNL